MTAEMLAEKAASLKQQGYNCAQAVVLALSEYNGTDPDALVAIASGFGGGMGTGEATCGALVGANIIAGQMTNGQHTVQKSRELLKRFQEACGATICKDLKGTETGVPLCSCPDCVRNAIYAAMQVLYSE